MFCGFVVDNLTLRRIDLWVENVVIVIYLILAGLSILFVNYYDNRQAVEFESGEPTSKFKKFFNFEKHKETTMEKLSIFSPFVMQFAFGGLFSVFIVFYARSASIFASWPFIITLFVLLVGTEFFRERYKRLTFQVSIYFIAVFSYSVFAVPVFFKKINAFSFLLSGLISIFIIALVILLIYTMIPAKFLKVKNNILISIASIFMFFNFLYFANIIPPIPLALMDSGIYHSLEKVGDDYAVKYEPAFWYNFSGETSSTVHWKKGEKIYYFSSVFAPTKFDTKIFHRWFLFDENKKEWIIKDTLSFSIVGGRDGGYRGYSYKQAVEEGKWKVEVVTEIGQILGRRVFSIIETKDIPELKESVKK